MDNFEIEFAEALRAKQDEWLTEFENECLLTPAKKHQSTRDAEIAFLRDVIDQVTQHINEGDYREAKLVLNDILNGIGCPVSENNIEYNEMAYKVLLMMRDTNEIFLNKRINNFLFRPSHVVQRNEKQAVAKKMMISDLVKEYMDYRKGKGELKNERTYVDSANLYAGLIRIMGDIPVSKIDYGFMDSFVVKARSLKKGWNSSVNKDKNIESFVVRDGHGTLSVNTINNWVTGYISPLFKYAVRLGYMDKNYSDGLTIKQSLGNIEERVNFSNEQLQLLFNSKEYSGDKFKKSWQFWVPILGYVTGARIEELCQLIRSDIAEFDGVLCISINDDEDKSVKNISSKRKIPLHSALIELGFDAYLRRFEINDRIFPELKKVRQKYSHEVSKWFGEYTIRTGMRDTKDGKSVFHSFRHGIVTYAAEQNLREDMRKRYTGHSERSVDDVYKHIKVSALKEHFVDKLVLPVGLSHLRSSKWCK